MSYVADIQLMPILEIYNDFWILKSLGTLHLSDNLKLGGRAKVSISESDMYKNLVKGGILGLK